MSWCQRLGFGLQTKQLIDQIRCSPPARRVGGGKRNVAGRYPSRKMGLTIQFESHSNELAAILDYEHDPDCLEFYDQPQPSIPLEYEAKNGQGLRVLHTADFFVLRTGSAGWVECKTEEDLLNLAQRSPGRFQGIGDGWRCPPGERFASEFGLRYQIRSSRETNQVYRRNLEFLEDYLRCSTPTVAGTVRDAILAAVSKRPGITVAELIRLSDSFGPDDIYGLIATGQLHMELRSLPLAEPERVPVFCDTESVCAHAGLTGVPPPTAESKPIPSAAPGQAIWWDERRWEVVNVGMQATALRGTDGSVIELPHPMLEALVRTGAITGLRQSSGKLTSGAEGQVAKASASELQEANRRYGIIRRYLDGERVDSELAPARTVYDWLMKYRNTEALYGNGFLGLIPRTYESGNRTSRLPELTRTLMRDFIENHYENSRQKTRRHVYGALVRACEAQDTPAPSYKTFTLEVARRPRYEQTLKRKGPRAAYPHEPCCLELDCNTPRHGDRPLQICHIDHTELDIELICSHTGQNLGRPWYTIMTDAFSRRLLALFLTFDPPSYRSCMMVIRDCVRRHGRFPQNLVVDGGKEFESVYFDTLLARFECTKKTRPPAKARFGSVCERLFGTSNTTFVHNLAGNTQITKNVRQVAKSVNPKRHAQWTLADLYECLCEWAYEVYDTIPHPALGQSPREAFAAGLARAGYRPHRVVSYDEEFRMWTLPTTARGTARVVPGKGVKINHVFYWAPALREPEVEGSQVAVRYDPYDAGTAYVYVHQRWVTCISEHYGTLRGKSERELMLATVELRRRAQKHAGQFTATAKKLADFLASAEGDRVLSAQRARDRESRCVLVKIQGGMAGQPGDDALKEPQLPDATMPTQSEQEEATKTLSLDELAVYEEY